MAESDLIKNQDIDSQSLEQTAGLIAERLKILSAVCQCKHAERKKSMTLSEIHGRLAITVLTFCGIMTIWAFWRFFRKQGISSSFWGAVIIVEIVIILQGLLGIYLWFGGLRPDRGVHWIYGASLALAMPLVFTSTKGRQERPETLMYGVGFLVMFFLVLRAMVTGG